MVYTEKIWYDDIPGFLTYTNYYHVLPLQEMSVQEKLNALVRFFIYLGIFLFLVRNDYRYMFLGIIAALISVGINQYDKTRTTKKETFLKNKNLEIVNNVVCSRSTVDNPFMNPSIADISLNPNHPQACDIENEDIKNKIDTNFNARIFRDVSDIFGKYASQRQFYTMPVTTIPSNQSEFGEWLYNRGPSCKEGNGKRCYDNMYAGPNLKGSCSRVSG